MSVSLTDHEKLGLVEFFKAHSGTGLVEQIVKTVTNNITTPENEDGKKFKRLTILIKTTPEKPEALNIILLHCSNVGSILNKRAITKEILFKYLHNNNFPVKADFTKATLVERVKEYWNQKRGPQEAILNTSSTYEDHTANNSHIVYSSNNDESAFPINIMAREFVAWFYNKYNTNDLKVEDFWLEVSLELQLISGDSIKRDDVSSNGRVLERLLLVKNKYNLYFNPNNTHEGTQGRMEVHGLVLLLSCGTLHTNENCIGTYDSVFGLMRDPYSENNWKVKFIKLFLKSSETVYIQPTLIQSEALQKAFMIPTPKDSLN